MRDERCQIMSDGEKEADRDLQRDQGRRSLVWALGPYSLERL